jgi:hypothetical protein
MSPGIDTSCLELCPHTTTHTCTPCLAPLRSSVGSRLFSFQQCSWLRSPYQKPCLVSPCHIEGVTTMHSTPPTALAAENPCAHQSGRCCCCCRSTSKPGSTVSTTAMPQFDAAATRCQRAAAAACQLCCCSSGAGGITSGAVWPCLLQQASLGHRDVQVACSHSLPCATRPCSPLLLRQHRKTQPAVQQWPPAGRTHTCAMWPASSCCSKVQCVVKHRVEQLMGGAACCVIITQI